MKREQASCDFGQKVLKCLAEYGPSPNLPYFKDEKSGLLHRGLKIPFQVIVPKILHPRLLALAYQTPVGAHAGGRKMYCTLAQHFYWP